MSSYSSASPMPELCLTRALTCMGLKGDDNLCAARQTDSIQGIVYKELFCQEKHRDDSL